MILLTTPIDTGALDEDYTHVRVQHFTFNREHKCITFEVAQGYLVDAKFTEGQHSVRKMLEIVDRPYLETPTADYTEMVGGSYGDEGVLLYDGVSATLDAWLLDNEHYVGTSV